MDPEYDQQGLVDLMSDTEDQIAQVDAALQFQSILWYKTPVTTGLGGVRLKIEKKTKRLDSQQCCSIPYTPSNIAEGLVTYCDYLFK
jgi:hypothetical protein